MNFSVKQRTDFGAAVKALRETAAGKEATMYTALRDLFVDILGYPKTSIVVDTAGARGRPDVTVYAPGGAASSRVSWIVMEAKDETGAVSTGSKRLKLYAEKAKYITADTAYFVMVDPQRLVARGAGLGRQEDADIEVEWATITPEAFFHALEPLCADVAGVPAVMQRFRDGDESLIACDRLSIDDSADAAAKLATRVNRNIFFDTLTETTRLLQASALRALAATRPAQDQIRTKSKNFLRPTAEWFFVPTRFRWRGACVTAEKRNKRTARMRPSSGAIWLNSRPCPDSLSMRSRDSRNVPVLT